MPIEPLTGRQYLLIFACTFCAGFIWVAVSDLLNRYL